MTHDCLANHLFRIDIYPISWCTLCDSKDEMDAQHLFLRPALSADGVCGQYCNGYEICFSMKRTINISRAKSSTTGNPRVSVNGVCSKPLPYPVMRKRPMY
ncbi:hypothetical protein CDAR_58191 [Caerostris darwini]|uniref:Uncharacterized protein n=1 Tax=Caerostris darwini TaxID=1538125 RepID=A0AAV4U6Z8_9ARAC|nr:hypothetical protein CDAR_58191 [Caerostris darwini]